MFSPNNLLWMLVVQSSGITGVKRTTREEKGAGTFSLERSRGREQSCVGIYTLFLFSLKCMRCLLPLPLLSLNSLAGIEAEKGCTRSLQHCFWLPPLCFWGSAVSKLPSLLLLLQPICSSCSLYIHAQPYSCSSATAEKKEPKSGIS